MENYEETLLQVTDVLKAHNRHHMNAPDHEQAVKAIRDIVTPKGKWIEESEETGALGIKYTWVKCSECGWSNSLVIPKNCCPNCGANMVADLCSICKHGDNCERSDKGINFANHSSCWKFER